VTFVTFQQKKGRVTRDCRIERNGTVVIGRFVYIVYMGISAYVPKGTTTVTKDHFVASDLPVVSGVLDIRRVSASRLSNVLKLDR
jgi:hypothetical protein